MPHKRKTPSRRKGTYGARLAAKKAWQTRRTRDGILKKTISLYFPLAQVELSSVVVRVNLKRQIISFKAHGEGKKQISFWALYEMLDGNAHSKLIDKEQQRQATRKFPAESSGEEISLFDDEEERK